MNYCTLAVRVILVFAILWRSSLALPTAAEGNRSPRADRETAERATLGLPENTSRILLVPGFMGSRLHAKVTLLHICYSSRPTLLWIKSLLHLLCVQLLKLEYSESTNTYSNRSDVEITVPDFGGTSAVECLSESCSNTKYYKAIVDYFVAKGYKRGVDIRAAPYDWRLAAGTARKLGYFAKLKSLIEDMYNGVGVTMVAHSMGGMMSLYFLNEVVTQEWKDKYIKAYVPIAVPYGGAVPALAAILSGSLEFADFEIPSFLISYWVADLSRSLESAYWLLPNLNVFNDCVIVETPSNSKYTAKHYREIFAYKNLPTEWSKYQGLPKTTAMNLICPNITTYCLYGTGVSTTEKLVYSERRILFVITYTHLETVKGDGDGKVNRKSLDVCTRWTDNVCTWDGSTHQGIINSRLTFETIESIINDQFACVR